MALYSSRCYLPLLAEIGTEGALDKEPFRNYDEYYVRDSDRAVRGMVLLPFVVKIAIRCRYKTIIEIDEFWFGIDLASDPGDISISMLEANARPL
jgi:hypothetical protein